MFNNLIKQALGPVTGGEQKERFNTSVEALNSSQSMCESIFVKFSDENNPKTLDEIDLTINEYRSKICQIKSNIDPLLFWKAHETQWPLISHLAKIMLGVPASSGKCENIFSLAGHIFNPKRRRLTKKTFEQLVFLKLNEDLL